MHSERLRTLPWRSLLTATFALVTVATALSWIANTEARRLAHRATDLQCLAENVYHVARGEPLVGQYAVAEVTMNRVRSRDFPDTVCGVVHEPGAFSWTYHDNPPEPSGYDWWRAQSVASAVYDNNEAPFVAGALFYHTTRISPAWAATRIQVTRIGRHLFYL